MKTLRMFAFACSLCLTVEITARAAAILTGPVTNDVNGHLYYLLTADTWPNAEMAAVQLGGHSATMNDAGEDAWVFGTFASFGGAPRILWIGLNDAATEGGFVWVSGETTGYQNWGAGEPNNSGDEDCVSYLPPFFFFDRGAEMPHKRFYRAVVSGAGRQACG